MGNFVFDIFSPIFLILILAVHEVLRESDKNQKCVRYNIYVGVSLAGWFWLECNLWYLVYLL